jgi:hypothetical protein
MNVIDFTSTAQSHLARHPTPSGILTFTHQGANIIMVKLTIAFGITLILLALFGFVYTGSAHPTALIPAIFGLFFVFFGVMANSDNPKKRMLWMHISVTVALLGFLGTIPADIDTIRIARGMVLPHPVAVLEKGAMSLLCLLYVLLCIRSFIAARRTRLA